MSDADALEYEDVPVYPEEFVGWRGWTVDGAGFLHSINDGTIWTPYQEFSAFCAVGRTHPHVPSSKCTCGIYMTNTLKKLRQNGYHIHGAFGMVSAWGHSVDGGDGMRTEFAYPRVIYVPYLSWKLVEPLEQYGVPVRLLNPFVGEPEPSDLPTAQ